MELRVQTPTLPPGSGRVRLRMVRGVQTPEGPYFPAVEGAPRTGRDTVLLNGSDIATAVREGYLDVDGTRVSLTKEAAAEVEKVWKNVEALNEAVRLGNELDRNRYESEQQIKAASEAADDLVKAMKIFGRIAKGGRVPLKDENFLREKMPALYTVAKNMAMLAKEHKKHKSVLKDRPEDESTPPTPDNTVYGAAASVEAGDAGAASGEPGGEAAAE